MQPISRTRTFSMKKCSAPFVTEPFGQTRSLNCIASYNASGPQRANYLEQHIVQRNAQKYNQQSPILNVEP